MIDMVLSVEEIYHFDAGVSEEESLALLEDQLAALGLRRETSCCSYGYTQEMVPYGMLPNGKHTPQLRRLIHLWVDNMIEQGMENFLCPMEQGADLMVAERVIARRSISDKPIRLIACLTHPDMKREIGALFMENFVSLCKQADDIVYADSTRGGRRARHILNQALLAHCSHALVVYQSNKPPQFLKDVEERCLTIAHIQTDKLL